MKLPYREPDNMFMFCSSTNNMFCVPLSLSLSLSRYIYIYMYIYTYWYRQALYVSKKKTHTYIKCSSALWKGGAGTDNATQNERKGKETKWRGGVSFIHSFVPLLFSHDTDRDRQRQRQTDTLSIPISSRRRRRRRRRSEACPVDGRNKTQA